MEASYEQLIPAKTATQSISLQTKLPLNSEALVRESQAGERGQGISVQKCSSEKNNGKWSVDEHKRFEDAIGQFGRDWVKVGKIIKTRTLAQIRSHAQKHFYKLGNNKRGHTNAKDLTKLKNPQRVEVAGQNPLFIPWLPNAGKKHRTELCLCKPGKITIRFRRKTASIAFFQSSSGLNYECADSNEECKGHCKMITNHAGCKIGFSCALHTHDNILFGKAQASKRAESQPEPGQCFGQEDECDALATKRFAEPIDSY